MSWTPWAPLTSAPQAQWSDLVLSPVPTGGRPGKGAGSVHPGQLCTGDPGTGLHPWNLKLGQLDLAEAVGQKGTAGLSLPGAQSCWGLWADGRCWKVIKAGGLCDVGRGEVILSLAS